jgi:hypothetical protein
MAKYSSVNFSLQIADTDGAGGTLRDITSYVTKMGDLTVSKGTVDATPFGVAVATYLLGVIKRYEPLSIEGLFDDAATTGPDAILNVGKVTHTALRKCTITIGGSKTVVGDASTGGIWLVDYKRTFNVGDYTGYAATVQFSGTITEN